MPRPERSKSTKNLEKFWEYFFVDHYDQAEKEAVKYYRSASSEQEKVTALELKAKILLRLGLVNQAYDLLKNLRVYSPTKLFLEFLKTGLLEQCFDKFADDIESLIYKSQSMLFTKIYCGPKFFFNKNINLSVEPDLIVEKVFDTLIDDKDYDRAILTAVQALEIISQDQEFGWDIVLPVISKQIDNLLLLSKKAKYDSTRAKVYLIKSKLFKDREAAEDAEILFGKDNNINGLGLVYSLYASEFKDEQYFDKAILTLAEVNNRSALGYIYKVLASNALFKGEIKNAIDFFNKSTKEIASNGCIFEQYGMEIQKISLLAIKGNYNEIEQSIKNLIGPSVPKLFRAQAYQILANAILQLKDESSDAKQLISLSSEYFEELKKYNQLLHAKNIHFQILLSENDLEGIMKIGEEIIQLASRLGDENARAAKYLDLAFATVKINLEDGVLVQEKLEQASEYFTKAVAIYQTQSNILGEADAYQAMGNLFASIGKIEEAYKSLLNAVKLYKGEGAFLQSAITDTLIGILMLDFSVLNEHTYKLAQQHFEEALAYYFREKLIDLTWKTAFYLASLNEKYYLQGGNEKYRDIAKGYYLEMLCAIQDYKQLNPKDGDTGIEMGSGIAIEDALVRGERFFSSIKEEALALKFKKLRK